MYGFIAVVAIVGYFAYILKKEAFGTTKKSTQTYLEQNMKYDAKPINNVCSYNQTTWPKAKPKLEPVIIEAVEEPTLVLAEAAEDTKAYDFSAYETMRAKRIQESVERMHEIIVTNISNEIAQAIYLGMRVEDAHTAIRTACESFSIAINDAVITEIVLEAHEAMENARYNELRPA